MQPQTSRETTVCKTQTDRRAIVPVGLDPTILSAKQFYVRRRAVIRNVLRGGITPETFESVKSAPLRTEDVYDEIHVVEEYPLQVFVAFYVPRALAILILYAVQYGVGNGFDLKIRIASTD